MKSAMVWVLLAGVGLAQAAGRAPPACSGEGGGVRSLNLAAGKSRFVALSEPVARLTVGNPEVLEARLVSSRGLYLVGMHLGATNLILQSREGACSVIDVNVALDAGGLQAALAELLPEEKEIRVSGAADSLVLSGKVGSALAAERAVSVATAFVRNGMPKAASSGPNAPAARVVNLLAVAEAQQVMLEVKVAEVSKTLLDQLGVRFSVNRDPSWGSIALLSDFLTGTAGGTLDVRRGTRERLMVEAEKRDGLVRVLAEPNVMALSGQEGSFLAGGKVLIPVSQSDRGSGATTITLEEKEFGVGLKFTPTVLGGGRINLKVAPEVSELSREGVGISASGALRASAVFPLITTRRASTTVQLLDGQSFAIGGLIKNSESANVKAFPFLGEIPVLGLLFRSTDFQSEKTELVFIVTPRLVKPLPPNTPLPTDKVGETDRNRLMLEGRLDSEAEGKP